MWRHAAGLLLIAAFARADCALPASSPQVQAARAVFAGIVQAAGNGNQPELSVVQSNCVSMTGPERGAWYEERYHRISLDAALVDLCADPKRGLGGEGNCLAFLLGHELAHVYREHYRTSTISSAFSRQGGSGGLDNAALEREADLFGGIYGYRAGYDSLSHAPEVLEAVYALYKLPAKLKGYPDLGDRKKLAQMSLADLRKLIPVFESATLLTLLGGYELAEGCFEYLSREFESREMFNDLGVAYALQLDSNPPAYPWVLDATSRLQPISEASRGETTGRTREELFGLAKQAFEHAQRLDPDYVPAYINLGCVYDLHEHGSKHAPLELEDGRKHLHGSAALDQALQSAEKAIASAGVPEPRKLAAELELSDEEQIGGQTASALLRERADEPDVRTTGATPVSIGPVKQYDTYSVIPVRGARQRWVFLGANSGPRIGQTLDQLRQEYCAPGQACGARTSSATGEYVQFRKAQAVFLLDGSGRVVRWWLYAHE